MLAAASYLPSILVTLTPDTLLGQQSETDLMGPLCVIDCPEGVPEGLEEFLNGELESEGHETELDLRGLEINRALAKYSIDRRGNLYELHSPRTEIPRLSPPKS
jgi:hypothetical protein